MLNTFTENPEIRELFAELHPPLTAQAAVVESNRCLNCFDAPCMVACPTHIDVPGFIVAQLLGAAAATLLFRWLAPSSPSVAARVVDREGTTP